MIKSHWTAVRPGFAAASIATGSALSFALSLLLSACSTEQQEAQRAEFPRPESAPGSPDFMVWDAARRVDPSTGTVPSERLWEAVEALRARENWTPMKRSSGSALAYTWQPVDDHLANLAVTAIVADPSQPQVLYFCTGEGWFNADAVRGAGIWKSTDAGQSWERLLATVGSEFWYCQDMLIHPLSGDLYVATRTAGIQRSQDGGNTWEQVLGAGNGSLRNSVCDLEVTADGALFAGIGIFETDGLYYSPSGDAGTWNRQSNGFPTTGIWRVEVATAPSNPLVAYAVPLATDYLIEGFYRTTDGGASWQEVENPGGDRRFAAQQGWYDLIVAVDPNDENTVVAGGLNLWRSRDGGDTWQRISSGRPDSLLTRYVHVDQHGIFFVNSDTVYFTNDGGIYRCDNFRSETPVIYPRNLGYNTVQYYAGDLAPDSADTRLLGGTQDNGSQVSLGDGAGPFKMVSGADGSFCRFDHSDASTFYTSKQYQPIYRFRQGGFERPDTLTNPLVSEFNLRFINPIEMDPNDPQLLYQASSRGLMRLDSAATARSEDWEQASRIAGEISAIGISTEPPNIVFLGRSSPNAELLRLREAHLTSSDDQAEPTDPNQEIPDAGLFGALTVTSIAVNPADANHVLITYGNYGVNSVWESRNALAEAPSWTSAEGNLPDVPVNWIMLHPGNDQVAYLATDMGVFYTDTLQGSATRWQYDSGFPTVRTDMLRYRASDYRVMAATHGRGFYTATLDPQGRSNRLNWTERGPSNIGGRTRALLVDPNDPSGESVWAGSVSGGLWLTRGISAVGVEPAPAQPVVSLEAFPNPFGGSVEFRLESTRPGSGVLEIFDLSGQRIAVPASGSWPAGPHSLRWQPPADLNPGVYLAVFRSDGVQQAVKLIYQPGLR